MKKTISIRGIYGWINNERTRKVSIDEHAVQAALFTYHSLAARNPLCHFLIKVLDSLLFLLNCHFVLRIFVSLFHYEVFLWCLELSREPDVHTKLGFRFDFIENEKMRANSLMSEWDYTSKVSIAYDLLVCDKLFNVVFKFFGAWLMLWTHFFDLNVEVSSCCLLFILFIKQKLEIIPIMESTNQSEIFFSIPFFQFVL